MIADEVLSGRLPRLGTITTGRTVLSRDGKAIPQATAGPVFHTDDREVADAVVAAFGGTVHESPSDTWGFDVVTREVAFDAEVMLGGARLSLEEWRAAQRLRLCDGVTATVDGGQATRGVPCPCASQPSRTCRPTTVVPVIVGAVDAGRLSLWEVRSTSWGTAGAVKGVLRLLALSGVTGGLVPTRWRASQTQVRDAAGKVWDVTEFDVTVLAAGERLLAIGSGGEALRATLTAGDDDPPDDTPVELPGDVGDLGDPEPPIVVDAAPGDGLASAEAYRALFRGLRDRIGEPAALDVHSRLTEGLPVAETLDESWAAATPAQRAEIVDAVAAIIRDAVDAEPDAPPLAPPPQEVTP